MNIQIKTHDGFFLEYLREFAVTRGDSFIFSSAERFCEIVIPFLLHETGIAHQEADAIQSQLLAWISDSPIFYKDAFVTFALAGYLRGDIWKNNLDVLTSFFRSHPISSSLLSVTITPSTYIVTGAKGVRCFPHDKTEEGEDSVLLYLLQNPANRLILQNRGYGFGQETMTLLFHLYEQRLRII